MPKLSLELGLPGLKIGVSDIQLRSGARGSGNGTGPFLIVSRSCGLALDTACGVENGAGVSMRSTHGKQQQLWTLFPTGTADEFSVRAAMGGLALDSTLGENDDPHPLLWRYNGGPCQRWRLIDTPDGIGHFLQSVHLKKFLQASGDTVNGWQPWFSPDVDQASWDKQWLPMRPYA